ncbi:MAG TPA: phosphopentomutase [Bacteroidetes bacterium]|nr:phosphopentomutase [Bacteroidota bacterium]
MGTFYLIIVDGLGVGAQEDSHLYGDVGANTLGHVSMVSKCRLPNLQKMGIGNIIPVDTVQPVMNPICSWGKLREVSAGKDSTTGHWEIAGVTLEKDFPTYPDGFPDEIVNAFCDAVGIDGVLVNNPYSGTEVIQLFGDEHLKTGRPILYTSADSVFQLACHESVTSVETLYSWCKIARDKIMIGDHAVGRVIARPFTGISGNYTRLTDQRHDFSLVPPKPNLPEFLQEHGIKTYSIGKIIDLFAECGFDFFKRTKNNAEGIAELLSLMDEVGDGFVFINLIDTDQLFGHRNDPIGYGKSLEEFDQALPEIIAKMKSDDVLVITGDHGNDPTTPGTDHTREFTPLLVLDNRTEEVGSLGIRSSFRDIAASACNYFQIDHPFHGKSFLK